MGARSASRPRVSGYVVELDVNDNQFVHAGDVLIRIDPRDYQAARDQAAGAVAIAKGQLAGAEAALAPRGEGDVPGAACGGTGCAFDCAGQRVPGADGL